MVSRTVSVESPRAKGTLFPSKDAFARVCRLGLSQIRPLRMRAEQDDPWGWNFGQVTLPSYWAYGRLRAMLALNQARQLRPRRVLEVAAGDAALSACLQQDGCEVIANDLRAENLEESAARYRNRLAMRLVSGNVFELSPEEIGRFDLVVACELIEHVAHAPELLRQLKRFLDPGGKILITTPNGSYFRNGLPIYSQIVDFKELEKVQFKPDSDGHLYLITAEELADIAKQAGLKVQSVVRWGTPFIYGDCGLRYVGRILPNRGWYSLELLCQRLGNSFLSWFANSLSVVLELAEDQTGAGAEVRGPNDVEKETVRALSQTERP